MQEIVEAQFELVNKSMVIAEIILTEVSTLLIS